MNSAEEESFAKKMGGGERRFRSGGPEAEMEEGEEGTVCRLFFTLPQHYCCYSAEVTGESKWRETAKKHGRGR